VDRGIDLSQAIDAYADGRGIRDAQGAWGVLTGNLITRLDSFRIAVINSFAPFFERAAPPNPR
jgi:non-canonical (house-cleaning) NTP pyrophosphatase